MEIRFFAPGSLVSNLDFVESIFGNAGDPVLPENDARLDVDHWTGHTGCVILAPHLVTLTKDELGLPHVRPGHRAPAPRRHVLEIPRRTLQRRPGLQDHLPLLTRRHRHHHRRQLLRLLQEGGEDPDQLRRQPDRPGRGGTRRRRHRLPQLQPGHRVPSQPRSHWPPLHRDPSPISPASGPRSWMPARKATPSTAASPRLIYIPADASIDLHRGTIDWQQDGAARSIPLRADRIYMTPAGQRFFLRPPSRLRPIPHRHHPAARHLLPQALHRQRRRQERDQQVAARLHDLWPDLRLRSGEGSRSGRADPPQGPQPALEAAISSQHLLRQDPPAHDPRLPPLARQRHQAADALARLHRRVQRLAALHPFGDPRPGLPHQAPLQARVGRELARALHRRHRQRRARPRTEGRQPQSRRHLPPRGLLPSGELAHLQGAPGLLPRGQDPDRGRHHRLRGRPRPVDQRRLGHRDGRAASSSSPTASTASSSGRTTPSTRASTSRPKPISPGPTTSSPTTSR